MIKTKWSMLQQETKNILEHVDIHGMDLEFTIGESIEFNNKIKSKSGQITQQIAEDIIQYQNEEESEGVYSAVIEGNKLNITFIKHSSVYVEFSTLKNDNLN